MRLFVFIFLISFLDAGAQKNNFQGTYAHYFGNSTEGAYQLIEICYLDSANILFYLEVGRGAPSYNSGAIYGRLTQNKKTGDLEYFPKDTSGNCSLELAKNKNQIIIKTIAGDCPFGYGVVPDGKYTLQKSTNPLFFTDRKGKKIYFKKIPPEEYLQ